MEKTLKEYIDVKEQKAGYHILCNAKRKELVLVFVALLTKLDEDIEGIVSLTDDKKGD